MSNLKWCVWGSTFIDYSLHKNFNVGFSSHKNDIHIHLSQWQYWWWFWFALVWSLYFFIILRLYNSKTENFNINLNTSIRSHGKWGDFLVAIIPLSWCGNILINSNFILRMIEWQNESSLFTVRIQGKQWYWVYKYSSDTNFRLNNVYINVGNNNWLKSTNQSNLNFNFNDSTMSFIFDYEFKKKHKIALNNNSKTKELLNKISLNNSSGEHTNFKKLFSTKKIIKFTYLFKNNVKYLLNDNEVLNFKKQSIINPFNFNFFYNLPKSKNNFNLLRIKSKLILINDFLENIPALSNINITSNNYDQDKLEAVYESAENLRKKSSKFPVKLLKGVLNKNNAALLINNVSLKKNIFLNYKLNNQNITQKISQVEQFWGFRQKKYKKLRAFSFLQNHKYNNVTYSHIESFGNNQNFSKYNFYTGVRNNKFKNELIPVTLARRLLRTKRTLILPAHINITLITSSYDVVHSWFVPGLGLKMDCVPGRSTHHSLYIDNIGFYYGQCAEICGRYHHHMPIRVCALAYEHFILWWQTKGLPRMYRTKTFMENKSALINKFKYKVITTKFKL